MSVFDAQSPFRNILGTTNFTSQTPYYTDSIVNGLDTDEIIWGTQGADEIHGNGGNDVIRAENGNDILDGGTGDDILDGGLGDDTYIFGKGYGHDKIDQDVNGNNMILFKEGIMPEDITLSSDWNGLYITINDTADKLEIYGYSWSASYRNFTLRFADGRTAEINYSNLKLIYQPLNNELPEPEDGNNGSETGGGTAPAITLIPTISGTSGNDNISGTWQDDIIDSGAGDDVIYGSGGNDTYIFGVGYGKDTINQESTGQNTIFLKGVRPEDITVTADWNSLVLTLSSGDSLTLYGYAWGESYRCFTVLFEDGTTAAIDWNAKALKVKTA
jgi:Ca2+-binding RTX toxin-like protein